MQFDQFVSSLSDEEFSILSSAVHERQRRFNERDAESIGTTFQERELFASGRRVEAMKALSDRVGCNLSVARMVLTRG